MDITERDLEIVSLYAGAPNVVPLSASKLAIKFGLSVPQIRRTLAKHNAKRHPEAPKPGPEEKIIDEAHRILGHRLYGHRFAKLNDPSQAANALGWSVKKLRSIEQGHSEISLSDLQDMAEYMKISISELTRNL